MAELNRFDIELDELRNEMRNWIDQNVDKHERIEFQGDCFLTTNEDALIIAIEKDENGTTYICYEEVHARFTYPLFESMESLETLNMIIERMPRK